MPFPLRPRAWAGCLLALGLGARARAAPGTTTLDFLRVGAAPRAEGMGEAFTGLADDVNAISYNPAGLAFLDRQEVAVMHDLYVSGVQQDFLGYVLPTRRLGSLAIAGNQQRVAPFDSYDANDQPAGTVSAQDLAVEGAYAFAIGPLALGGVYKHISSRLAGFTAAGNAYDAGALLRLGAGFALGGAVQNIGPGLAYERASSPLPLTSRGGVSWSGRFLWPGSSCALDLDGVFPRDRSPFYDGGGELWLLPYAALRLGYQQSQDADNLGLSWGAGFRFPLGAGRSDEASDWAVEQRGLPAPPAVLALDYAFVRLGNLGITHRISVSLYFGRSKAPDEGPAWENKNGIQTLP